MAETMLKVDNINVYYGNIHAVKDVSFEVNEGEIVTLIGALQSAVHSLFIHIWLCNIIVLMEEPFLCL